MMCIHWWVFLVIEIFFTDFFIIYNLKWSYVQCPYPDIYMYVVGFRCHLIWFKVPHTCGCVDRFRTLFIIGKHTRQCGCVHEKTPEVQTWHHWESSLSARRKFKSLIIHWGQILSISWFTGFFSDLGSGRKKGSENDQSTGHFQSFF